MFFVHLFILLALPTCIIGADGRDLLIKCYFMLGYEYRLIICFLYFVHGISISLRQLKRTLRRLQLRRRRSSLHGLTLRDGVSLS